MKLCFIQETCPSFTNGTKRKVHHIRITEPCTKWIDMSCDMGTNLRLFHGEEIACDIKKMLSLRKSIY